MSTARDNSKLWRLLTSDKAFFIFPKHNKLRRFATALVRWPWFERFSLLVIAANCLSIATNPCENKQIECTSESCRILRGIDLGANVFFLLEMLIRMLSKCALGHRKSYLADAWNRFDFLIVLASIFDYLNLGNSDWTIIRVIRILRPLRAIKRIPSLRLLVTLLCDALPALSSIIGLMLFVYFIFGIVGIQLWSGALRNRCSNEASQDQPCGGVFQCSSQQNSTCLPTDLNPLQGGIGFDNIFIAFITIFQSVSPEGWTEIMYTVQDAYSFWVWPYFVILVCVVTFSISNLSFIVVAVQIPETRRRLAERERLEQERLWRREARKKKPLSQTNSQQSSTVLERAIRPLIAKLKGRGPASEHESVYTLLVDLLVEVVRQKMSQIAESQEAPGSDTSTTLSRRTEYDSDFGTPSPAQSCFENGIRVSRKVLNRFFSHLIFEVSISLVILLGTISMAIEHYGQPQQLTFVVDLLNLVLTLIFAVELILKIYAFGLVRYIRDGFNMLDLIIVVISLVELFQSEGSEKSSLTVLRTFRLLRIFKLLRFSKAMQHQLVAMFRTLNYVAPFLLLFSLFIFIFVILGSVLFGCESCHHVQIQSFNCSNNFTNSSAANNEGFASLLSSLLSVLKVLTQDDNWSSVLRNTMNCQDSYWSAIFFVCLLMFGNYVLLSMLLAVIDVSSSPVAAEMDSRPTSSLKSRPEENDNRPPAKIIRTDSYLQAINEEPIEDDSSSAFITMDRQKEDCPRMLNRDITTQTFFTVTPSVSTYEDDCSTCIFALAAKAPLSYPEDFALTESESLRTAVTGNEFVDFVPKKRLIPSNSCCEFRKNYSLFLLSPKNRFRSFLQRIVTSRIFDRFLLIFVGINCVTVALERPSIEQDSLERNCINVAEYAASSVFFLEALLKILVSGFVLGPDTYLRNGWNIVDFILVLSSILDLIQNLRPKDYDDGDNFLKSFRVLRLLRAFKPLRAIHRTPALKVVVGMFGTSIKSIANIMLICGVFYLAFGVLGLQLFRGCFHRCVANGTLLEGFNITNRTECEATLGLAWQEQSYNFDNFPNSLIALMVVVTFDGWVDITQNALDCTGIDLQPLRNNNPWRILYFLAFIMIIGFCVVEMFMGVIINNYRSMKHQLASDIPISKADDQLDRKIVEAASELEDRLAPRLMKRRRAVKVQSSKDPLAFWATFPAWRRRLFHVCNHVYFDLAIACLIGLNIVAMATEHYQMPAKQAMILKWIDYGFMAIFILELCLKTAAFGPLRYLRDGWNRLDLVIVLLSLGNAILDLSEVSFPMIEPRMLRVLKIVRVIRALKLLKVAKGIRALLAILRHTLPQLASMSLLFVLIFFIYAALGVELMGRLPSNCKNDCDGLSRHANFANFGMALLTIFRISTGDNWKSILEDAVNIAEHPETRCFSLSAKENDCLLARSLYPLYFISFYVMTQFFMVNLVVACLMQHLEKTEKQGPMAGKLSTKRKLEF